MKSIRRRFETPQANVSQSLGDLTGGLSRSLPVRLRDMPAPAPVLHVSPDQVVADILVSTLLKVQRSGSAEIAAAAERYLSALR